MKSDLSKVKVGDKIFTIEDGWTNILSIDSKVSSIDNKYTYPIATENNTYTIDGKVAYEDKYPSAFLEYPFKEQEIEKDTFVWFRDGERSSWKVGFYSHFKAGKHYCFVNSKKSTETNNVTYWNIVTTENPLS
jgi:hypothetical protein